MEEELAPLSLQLALVQSRLGRHSEAEAAYQVFPTPPPPPPTLESTYPLTSIPRLILR